MKPLKRSFLFLLYFSLAICHSQRAEDSLSHYSSIALHPKQSEELIAAFKYFNKRLDDSKASKDFHTQLNSLYYISSINYKIGAYGASEEAAVVAIDILDKNSEITNQLAYRRSFYNLLGVVYTEQQVYTKAVELYERVLNIASNTRDSVIVYNNIANVHKRNNLIDKAHKNLLEAYQLIPRLKDTLTIALISNNLGLIKTKIKQFDEGRSLLFKALELRNQFQDSTALYSSFSNLTKFYLATDSIVKAKFYATKALKFANQLQSPTYRQDALGLMVDVSPDTYAKAYKILNDSLTKLDRVRINKFALMRYDYSEYKRQALESQLREQDQRSRAIISTIVALSIGLISILVFFFLRTKYKREKLQEVMATESRISKQVHDEVANNVFQVMTKFETGTYENSVLADDLNHLYYKARDISNQLEAIDSKASFKENLEMLFESYESDETNIIIKGFEDIHWESFSSINKNIIYKVLQELLINMKKHSRANLVMIAFENKNKKTHINYSDNGAGAVLVKHTGLHNTENRINSIGGTITFETEPDKGFKVKIVI
ncbi:ATP-binding protein [Winogradskyella aquimaris]|uniref:histidine kinase n=1 Tax=Winogradskyella aquimaris TaxID=864074 RepID=A0ABU5ETR4_9FLAO|nr:tetratricopeptide repeat protein [Winogradskyella aquimaris]MDY2588194.1 tetratricopeptide repeat protein [Winogradskyella aquimaris]